MKALDPDRTEKKAFIIDPTGLRLANRLEQKRVARECAAWIRDKVAIRSVRQSNLLHGNMYHISHSGLLQKAVDSIVATFRRRVAAGLQSGRDFVIPDRTEQANGNDEFELITWLVVREGA